MTNKNEEIKENPFKEEEIKENPFEEKKAEENSKLMNRLQKKNQSKQN